MGVITSLRTRTRQAAIVTTADQVVRYIQRDPEHNIDTALKLIAGLDTLPGSKGQLKAFIAWIESHPGAKHWFNNLLNRDPHQVRTLIRNLIGNCSLKWMQAAEHFINEDGFCPPYTILISPTMRCNLKCKGCYAMDYSHSSADDLDRATIERIIDEGKQLGVYLYTILGGEPFIRFDDIYAVARKHSDCLFLIFSNGSLITEDVAAKLHELGNIVVVFSVNGTREETEYMRGPGAYDRVLEAMRRMRAHNLMFGISLVLTSKNFNTLMSYEFLKFWEAQGAVFGWNFLFMPVGPNPDLSLMPSPEQRMVFGEFIKRYREQEPLFIMDFWADAPAVSGCIAGGRRFLHINNRGDVEPCIFAHHATHNIHDCSLKEAIQSPFFTFIRMSQPHTDNYLRPCMLIDNPQVWRTACKRFGARPTEPGAERIVSDPAMLKALDDYSLATARIVDPYYRANYQPTIDAIVNQGCAYGEGIDRLQYRLDRTSFLDRMEHWATHNPGFVQIMHESLEYLSQTYGADSQRQPVLVSQAQPSSQQSTAL